MSEYINLVGSVVILSLVFYPFELLLPAEKGQPVTKRLVNLAYVPLFLALAIFVLQPVANVVASKILTISDHGLLPRLSGHNSFIVQILFAVSFAVFWDFWQYWLHRWQHRIPWLWETHKFHHSDTALNATTQSRHHILHLALANVFYLPVLVIFNTQAPHYVALFVMFRLWGFVNHANLRIDIGPLTPVVSGPQWHRIHHSILEEHRDKNFATFFPFIDKLFGTYYRPRKNEYPPSGLQAGGMSRPVREATFEPFLAWYRNGSALLNRMLSSIIFRLRLLVGTRA
jgi:sterol desaturase/sphingolipid hydroxylase (fatty acid hydroxylase superfamily)